MNTFTKKKVSVSAKRSQPPKSELTVGELAKRSGLTVSAIHFYERQKLIKSWRTGGNQRRFPRSVLRQLAIVKVAQRVGIPLREIRDALKTLPDGRAPTLQDWKKLSARWETDLNTRIDQLTALRDQLSSCIGCGCLSLSECPLRNPLDQMAREGTGARLLENSAGQ